jgi:sigma-B regulation protein RsbU (phosphoserine phosphatase)
VAACTLQAAANDQELAVGSDRTVSPAVLMSDVAGAVNRAASFPDAVEMALATLRDRVGAQFILLLERTSDDEYRCADFVLPAQGVLISRLRHYPHSLPLTVRDVQAWQRWARELSPAHAAEIERLEQSGARIAVPLRTQHELPAVLLLGPPRGSALAETGGTREEFTPAERQLMDSAADVFALLIENARLNARALEQEKLRRDVALAAEVQRRLLPSRPPVCPAVGFAAFTLPARTVGGDYYDFIDVTDQRVGVAIADIAGKGIPAALLMSAVQASLRVIAQDPDLCCSQLAAQLNRLLYQSTATSSYATLFYAQLDLRKRRLSYVNAGHNPPYLVRRTMAGVSITELSVGGTVLGLFPEVEYEEGHVDLLSGDLLVAYTDGVTDARNVADDEFGEERLKDLLRGSTSATVEEISSALQTRIRDWMAGTEQYDDVTFVVASLNRAQGASLQ